MRDIVILAERSDGRIMPVMHELLAFAQALAENDKANVHILVPGRELQAIACDLARETGMAVTALENDALEPYTAEAWMAALTPWLAERSPRYICIAHTSRGCDLAPGLAVRLGAACITAVEGVHRQHGATSFSRSMFNGKIRMFASPETDTAVLTVLPGAFKPLEASRKRSGSSLDRVQLLRIPDPLLRVRAMGVHSAMEEDTEIAKADVIVSAGRGIGAAENMEWIRRLAALFPKAALGCSRPVCDQGWLEYKHQVGLTGRTVAPKLYIACGISGAVQHVAGMGGSRLVVAVNKDPRAAIFQMADIGIVEDLNTFIPLVVEKAKDRTT